MASYNKVFLMGNVTRDPEMKFTQAGTPLCNFGLAINEKYTDKATGEQKENTCFVEVEAWERQAEVINEYVSKGDPLFLEGALKFDSWETPEGQKRNRLTVRAIRVQLLKGREVPPTAETQTTATETPQHRAPRSDNVQVPDTSEATTEDDIPF